MPFTGLLEISFLHWVNLITLSYEITSNRREWKLRLLLVIWNFEALNLYWVEQRRVQRPRPVPPPQREESQEI